MGLEARCEVRLWLTILWFGFGLYKRIKLNRSQKSSYRWRRVCVCIDGRTVHRHSDGSACARSALSLRHSAAPSLEHLRGSAADVRAVAGIQPALQHLRGCLGSPAIWIATSVCLMPHMWPTARSCAGTPPWTKTTNFSGTSGPSTCTRSSMNGFSSWLTSLCSSSHSLETRSVSYEAPF